MRFDINLPPSRETTFIVSVRNCVAAKWIQAEESCACRSENLKFRHQTIGWMEADELSNAADMASCHAAGLK
ncbi:MAG: hypothetical protein ACK52S_22590 [Pirellula sp.]